MTHPALEVRALRRLFRQGDKYLSAVDNVSLTLQPGEVLGLGGESGSGKSTLGRIIAGLLPRSAGEVWVDGVALPQHSRSGDFRRGARTGHPVQMVFQDSYASLNPRLTIGESLGEPLMIQGARRAEIEQAVEYWLTRVGLPAEAAERYPHEMSGGQRQRVGIARAFISKPKLVVCDEPVSALDVSVQAQIIQLLRDIQREQGTAMLFIAHDLAVVRYLAARTAVMYLGEIVELGESPALFSAPTHPYTRQLLAAHLEPEPGSSAALDTVAAPAARALPLSGDRGCRFAPRCPFVDTGCRRAPPWLQLSKAGTEVACHRLRVVEAADC